MTTLQTIVAGSGAATVLNENVVALSPAGMYGRRAAGTSGLTWGYYGGRGFGNTIADGSVTLSASSTNYVVANRTSGAVSVSTATTNWNDTGSYYRLYQVVTGVATVSSYTDYREFAGGSGGGAMTNPMTAAGDLIYGGTVSGGIAAPQRLAVSTNGYVLTLAAGIPSWAAASGGALTNWTEANSSAAPNSVYNCTSFTATGAFAALVPGTTSGGVLAAIPNDLASGGARRGLRSADFQVQRAAAADVAGAANSFIGSGYANRIDSGNDYSVIPGGFTNSITGGSGQSSAILGGDTNSISATGTKNTVGGGGSNSITGGAGDSTIVGGTSNSIVAGIGATILGGNNNRSPGNYSAAMGLQAAGRAVTGVFAHASGKIATRGDAQYERYVLSRQTTDATAAALTSTQGAASASNQPLLATDSALAFTGRAIARSSADSAGWKIEGTIANVGGTVALSGTPTVTAIGATGGAASWVLAVVADNTNKCLQVTGTGAAATTVNWTCALDAAYSGS